MTNGASARAAIVSAHMRVLIIGATGRIGRFATLRALDAGHEVVALLRDPEGADVPEGVDARPGDLRDPATVQDGLVGTDAVICAVGVRANTEGDELELERGVRNLVVAMRTVRVDRLVTLSGAGVDVPGDHKPVVDRMMSRLVRFFAGHVVGAKQREYEILAASNLTWTALRPPLVVDGTARGYRLATELRPGVRVTRADVGQALVDQLGATDFVRAAPFVLPF
jgi:putative NADH-flavin reductase